jgi:lipopolysaccharide export system protein LptC
MLKNFGTTVFPLLVLGMLASLTLWLERTANFDDLNKRAKARHDPDFRIEQFSVRHFNSEGDIKQSLTAKQMQHYPDDDTSELTAPTLTYYNGSQPTTVSSRRAWLNNDGKEVRLYDNVHLVRKGEEGGADTVLETSRLTVFPDDQLARGTAPVTIRQGQSVISGSGLEYDGKRHIAVLRGRAQGTFYKAH